jgi:hypothetical protein
MNRTPQVNCGLSAVSGKRSVTIEFRDMLLECRICEAVVDAKESAQHEFAEALGEEQAFFDARVTLAIRCRKSLEGVCSEHGVNRAHWPLSIKETEREWGHRGQAV